MFLSITGFYFSIFLMVYKTMNKSFSYFTFLDHIFMHYHRNLSLNFKAR